MMKKPFNNLSNKIRKVHLQVTLDGIETRQFIIEIVFM